MTSVIKLAVFVAITIFVVALISPVKAVYIVNISSSYLYIAINAASSYLIELAIKLRS